VALSGGQKAKVGWPVPERAHGCPFPEWALGVKGLLVDFFA